MNGETPLLRARDARIDMNGAVAVERITFDAKGPRVALVGEGYAVLAVLAGAARVRAGSLHLFSSDVARGEHLGLVGLAPLDPPMFPSWSGLAFVTWGARLSGMTKARAYEVAEATLSELQIAELARAELGGLGIAARRALVLAQAVVASPQVLVASTPLVGLDGPSADEVGRVLGRAQEGRASIVSVSTPWPFLHAGTKEHGLLANADDVLVFAAGGLIRQGKLAALEEEATGYLVTLRSKGAEFVAAISARGARCEGGPARFWVHLPPHLTEKDLLATSVEVGAPLVELVPRLPRPSRSVLEDGTGSP